ncbi:MAG TPA: tRNA uracil 4-sulfurtransferase ThiI [Bacillota bacterium]|nr:tRNA uracil 4-sulfurtransferase ThiI [Bacillota bacterium]
MIYDHLLIRYGELSLKGGNQKLFIRQLQQNIREKLKSFENISLKRTQGRMFIVLNGHEAMPVVHKLQEVFGIHSMSLALRTDNDEASIKAGALFALKNCEKGATFKVAVRRANKQFPIGSQEMNHILGAHLLRNTEGFTVDVHEPDVEIQVEIRHEGTYIMSEVIPGLGGFPVGTGSRTLLLLSGGIDSPVAGYLMMKRGVTVEAIHFASPPFTSERAKQKVIDLAKQLTRYGKRLKVHFVPFTNLQQAIHQHIPDRYAMTVMRRMMLRIAEAVCEQSNILSITTGESLGQVASQTMESMNVINEVTNVPVIRPLVTMDKQEIIEISREINTYDISIRPYEDCCTIFNPKSPKTKPKREPTKRIESAYDFSEKIAESIAGIEVIEYTENETIDSFEHLL